MGSKDKYFIEMMKFILKNRKINQWYIEPFVGGCNSIDKVDGQRIASDINKYLIALWQGLQSGRLGIESFGKELYSEARDEYNKGTNIKFDDFELGWFGFMGSFNGRFYDGGFSGKTEKRDYIKEQVANTKKQIPLIKDIVFKCCNYSDLEIIDNSIVYCDPPYRNTKQYSNKNFDYEKYYNWIRNISRNNEVYVSEYEMPSDFECVWQKEVTNSLNTTLTKRPIEKLFRIKN